MFVQKTLSEIGLIFSKAGFANNAYWRKSGNKSKRSRLPIKGERKKSRKQRRKTYKCQAECWSWAEWAGGSRARMSDTFVCSAASRWPLTAWSRDQGSGSRRERWESRSTAAEASKAVRSTDGLTLIAHTFHQPIRRVHSAASRHTEHERLPKFISSLAAALRNELALNAFQHRASRLYTLLALASLTL